MKEDLSKQLPVRTRREMASLIARTIQLLHRGELSSLESTLQELKALSLYMEEAIQSKVLIFAEQVQFQSDVDPQHCVNLLVQESADKLLEALGFSLPPSP